MCDKCTQPSTENKAPSPKLVALLAAMAAIIGPYDMPDLSNISVQPVDENKPKTTK